MSANAAPTDPLIFIIKVVAYPALNIGNLGERTRGTFY